MNIYVPSPQVVERMKLAKVILLVGASGSGKSTLISAVTARCSDITFVPTVMSRSPRPGEIDGRDAYFKSREEMEDLIANGAFVQVAPTVFGDYYATLPESYPPQDYSIMPCLAEEVRTFQNMPLKSLQVIVILPPSVSIWHERMQSHLFAPDKLSRRLREAGQSFRYAEQSHDCKYIINDDLQRAATQLELIVHGGAGDDPQASRHLANQLAAAAEAHQLA